MQAEEQQPKKKFSLKGLFSLGEVGGYFFRKKDPSRPANMNLKLMHGINKLAIFIFLFAVLYWLVKRFLF